MKKRFCYFAIILIPLLSTGFKQDSDNPTIINPYSMYLYDTLLVVSDSINGLLIYSVADIQAPRFKAHIPLKGNRGMAMKDSIIFANSWGGILAIRLVNDTDYEVTSVIKTDPYHSDGMFFETYPTQSSWDGFGCSRHTVSGAASETSGSGTGGSYAVFAVIDSFLYYIDNQSIITMDITKPAVPRKLSETYIDWSIETLFPTKNNLFIGGTRGMYVMDRADPAHPMRIGSITHFRAKDPVVVKDSTAYVTLRTALDPAARTDELMVVNIGPIADPKLIKEIPLATPYGLTIVDTLLYVAQGAGGWSLFSLASPQNPAVVRHYPTPNAKDFIRSNDLLFMMCFDRIQIYSVSDPLNPTPLAHIE
jgi:hypothetical protein